jgi:hypothetical protein
MQIQIKTGAVKLNKIMTSLEADQLPFAMARTLSGLAYEGRDRNRKMLDRYFKLRTKWVTRTFAVTRAEKKDFPHQEARLSVRDRIMALAATGGTRKPASGDDMAIPVEGARPKINPRNETLGPRYFPGRIVKKRKGSYSGRVRKAKPFYIKLGGKMAVARRRGAERYPLDILYIFKKQADVPQQWPLIRHTERMVRRMYGPRLRKELNRAVETARTGSSMPGLGRISFL